MLNLPQDFKEKMKDLLGDEYSEFSDAFEADDNRVYSLRINTSKVRDEEELLTALFGPGFQTERIPWEQKGIYYDSSASPGKHPFHEAGLYYIQEPSAMAPVHYLDPKPGDRVLDLCAAPGGKSTQIADCLKGQGLLITNEINRDRAKILSLNIERMGISNAMVLNEDSGRLSQVFEGYFDKILVDAPCSGEGMFRKNEIAASEWSLENVRMCAERQGEILDNAAKMLQPGGRLVYSTCTFAPEENEQTIAGFLFRHSDFHTEKIELTGGIESGRAEWADIYALENESAPEGESASARADRISQEIKNTARLWPHKVRGEGHFLCVLKRDGELRADAQKSYIPGGRFARAKKESMRPFLEFAIETLDIESAGGETAEGLDLKALETRFKTGDISFALKGDIVLQGGLLSFGDQLYLEPSDMPSPEGLKVIRPGLHLGTVKKDRFEPSHALALALDSSSVILSYDLASDCPEIRQFLNGQTIRPATDMQGQRELLSKKGWCLITCDGYSTGWAKLAGGMLKNHYPKGLRINY